MDGSPAAAPVRSAGRSARLPTGVRLTAAAGALGCAAMLVIGALLTPDGRGFGTHEQLGKVIRVPALFGPCGMLLRTGLPCPTCGMITAVAYAAHGRFVAATIAQPAGLLLALGCAILAPALAWAALRGRWPLPIPLRLTPNRLFIILTVALLGGWAYKMIVVLATRQAAG